MLPPPGGHGNLLFATRPEARERTTTPVSSPIAKVETINNKGKYVLR
jgi:hypothetical protein